MKQVLVERAEPRELRLSVLEAIQAIAQSNPSLSPDLTNIIKNPNEDMTVRIKAARALGSVGPDADAIKILIGIVEDSGADLELRRAATVPLMSQAPVAKGAANVLRAILRDTKQDTELRCDASHALALIKSGSQDDVKAIIDILQDPKEPVEVRRSAASFAGALQTPAADAVPALCQIFGDSHADWLLRRIAGDALMQIRPHSTTVMNVLRLIIYDRTAEPYLRRRATWVLGTIGSEDVSTDPQIIPVLLDVLNNADDLEMRTYAVAFLGQMDPAKTKLVPTLIETAENSQEDPNIRRETILAIGNVGRNYSVVEALPGLIRLLTSDKEQAALRVSVVKSLAMIKAKPETTIPILIEILVF